jgi:hypothetical protein
MKAIGLDHRTRELIGWHRTTTANGSMKVTGREIAGGLNTTTVGTATRIGTTAAETTTHTVVTTMTIDNRLKFQKIPAYFWVLRDYVRHWPLAKRDNHSGWRRLGTIGA